MLLSLREDHMIQASTTEPSSITPCAIAISRRLSRRSATCPPNSATAMNGITCASPTKPSIKALPVMR